jgi:hypothetical protein
MHIYINYIVVCLLLLFTKCKTSAVCSHCICCTIFCQKVDQGTLDLGSFDLVALLYISRKHGLAQGVDFA